MSDIPLARDILLDIRQYVPQRLHVVFDEALRLMVREPPVRKTRPKARRMTKQLADQIRRYCATHPDLSHREIGAIFGVDGGRVSEVESGKR